MSDSATPGPSIHGLLQARILEWVAISFSRVSSRPRDRTCVSYVAGGFFTTEPPGRPLSKQRPSSLVGNRITQL